VSLTVRLRRLSPRTHELAYARADGSGERLELETRSFLFHDLLHFAVETEARLGRSFYGTLARAESYRTLAEATEGSGGEIGQTEGVVGRLTGYWKGQRDAAAFVARAREQARELGGEMPAWFTEAFVRGVEERMRRLLGEWNALPFGETMTLEFRVA